MADEYAGRADFELNLRYIMDNQTEVGRRINRARGPKGEDIAGLIACQGDINIVLARIADLAALVTSTGKTAGAPAVSVDVKALAQEVSPYLQPVDYEKLATLVADKLAARLAN